MKIFALILALVTLTGCAGSPNRFSQCMSYTGVKTGQGAGEATVKLLASPITAPVCVLAGITPSSEPQNIQWSGPGLPQSTIYHTPSANYTVTQFANGVTVNTAPK